MSFGGQTKKPIKIIIKKHSTITYLDRLQMLTVNISFG